MQEKLIVRFKFIPKLPSKQKKKKCTQRIPTDFTASNYKHLDINYQTRCLCG
jgi:hypothetical protein